MKAGPLCVAHCVFYALSSFTCPSRKNPNPNLPTVYIRRARAQTFKHLVLQTVALARGTIRTSCVIALRRATSDFLPQDFLRREPLRAWRNWRGDGALLCHRGCARPSGALPGASMTSEGATCHCPQLRVATDSAQSRQALR